VRIFGSLEVLFSLGVIEEFGVIVVPDESFDIVLGSGGDLGSKGLVLVVAVDTEDNVGEVSGAGVFGEGSLRDGGRSEFEFAIISSANGEAGEIIRPGSSDTVDVIELVTVFVDIVGDDWERVSDLELEVLGVGSHVIVSDDGGNKERVVERSWVSDDDDFGRGRSSTFEGFSEMLGATASVFKGGDVAGEFSLFSEGGEQVQIDEGVSPVEDDSDLIFFEESGQLDFFAGDFVVVRNLELLAIEFDLVFDPSPGVESVVERER
jgi:hypothetical protein